MAADPWATGPYANDTYLRSLAASSSDTKRQVGNALNEIARQKVVNQGQAGKVADTTRGIYQGGANQSQSDADILGVRQSGALQRGFASGQEAMGKIQGLWQQGFGERETRQRGAANNIGSELQRDLREKGFEYVSKRQQEDRQRAHEAQMAAQQRALQEEMMRRQAAMQAQAQSAAQRAAEEQWARELWIANSNLPWPGQPLSGSQKSKANYLGMKDQQNL
jgi:Skp family chaperone for outer membrane proteins